MRGKKKRGFMKKIAIYGKGGIGKSTTVSNLSAAMAARGLKVMQIGCDPKADSTRNLTGGTKIQTVLDVLRDNTDITLEDIVVEGDLGVLCVEAGGPVPGVGCAGRGIITAFEKLSELEAYERYQPDIVLYDVLGDVVCGGFAMPIRGGYAEEVCIVTSGEMMALYAASNIAYAVKSFGKRGYASLKGLIFNAKNIEREDELVRDAAREIETDILFKIDRNPMIQKAEDLGKTVVAAFPDSALAEEYNKLSRIIFP
ncbi:nitrogenase iron protein NifH [Clostridium sp. KNHs205]|uniref:nitrogenase iron protein NifH n=1 Tax=Clostridium sp. KNHs205 TaxID=1449050 RepID=UPI00325A5E01